MTPNIDKSAGLRSSGLSSNNVIMYSLWFTYTYIDFGKSLDDLSYDSCIRGLILYFRNLTQPLTDF